MEEIVNKATESERSSTTSLTKVALENANTPLDKIALYIGRRLFLAIAIEFALLLQSTFIILVLVLWLADIQGYGYKTPPNVLLISVSSILSLSLITFLIFLISWFRIERDT